jgi:trehalose/maltose transport system permease protein
MRSLSWGRLGFYVAVVIISAYCLAPLVWAALSSLKTGAQLYQVTGWPDPIAWENYRQVFLANRSFGQNLLNSLWVALVTVAIALVFGLLAAYPLARIHFRGRRLLLLAVLSVTMFPPVAVLAGMIELIRMLGVYNSLSGLILSYMLFSLPFTVWVLTTFMRDLPRDLEEAALVDGASALRIIGRVFMPMLWPALVATGILAFISAWNEFLFALTFTLTNDVRTVPVAIAMFSGASEYETPWGLIMAASVMVTLPLIALVIIFQRRIVSGLAMGALKG